MTLIPDLNTETRLRQSHSVQKGGMEVSAIPSSAAICSGWPLKHALGLCAKDPRGLVLPSQDHCSVSQWMSLPLVSVLNVCTRYSDQSPKLSLYSGMHLLKHLSTVYLQDQAIPLLALLILSSHHPFSPPQLAAKSLPVSTLSTSSELQENLWLT